MWNELDESEKEAYEQKIPKKPREKRTTARNAYSVFMAMKYQEVKDANPGR